MSYSSPIRPLRINLDSELPTTDLPPIPLVTLCVKEKAADMSVDTQENIVVAVEPQRQRRQYKCWHCPKVFKRSEHCIRHQRIHTQEKPFSCRFCQKSYSRKCVNNPAYIGADCY